MAEVEEDKALAKLTQMETEFVAHKARLQQRTKEIHDAVTAGTFDVKGLGEVVVEIMMEFHDTGLSFQHDLVRLIRDEWQATEDAEDDDIDDDDDDADPADVDSQLLPGDAAQLRRTTTDAIAFLDAWLANPELGQNKERQMLTAKRKDAAESLKLINEIEITDDDPAADEAADDAEPGDDAADATPDPN